MNLRAVRRPRSELVEEDTCPIPPPAGCPDPPCWFTGHACEFRASLSCWWGGWTSMQSQQPDRSGDSHQTVERESLVTSRQRDDTKRKNGND